MLAIYKDELPVEFADKENDKLVIIFDKTPFYPEGGGQISDIGIIENTDCRLTITNVQKAGNSIIHLASLSQGKIKIADKVNLKIDLERRKSVTIHHSSTHLLHQALRDVLGNHVEQKGSLVTNNGLRFDFSHNKALNLDEISRIEKIIAFEIDSAKPTSINKMSYSNAIKAGALAFFDEKYDDAIDYKLKLETLVDSLSREVEVLKNSRGSIAPNLASPRSSRPTGTQKKTVNELYETSTGLVINVPVEVPAENEENENLIGNWIKHNSEFYVEDSISIFPPDSKTDGAYAALIRRC